MNDEQILEYLERFSDELTKGTIVIDFLRMMAWMFVKGMAWIVDAFQNITDSMLGLKLLYDNPQITEFVNTMQPVLVILMAINLMFIGYLLILKQDAVNRPALVSNIFMALAIMTILSVGMNQANEFTDEAVDAVNFENGTSTLADEAITNNITDAALYDVNDWETTELDESNKINPSYAQDLTINAPLNEDTNINSEDDLSDDGQDIVSKKIQTLPDGTREVVDLEDGGWISSITQEYYYRYEVDWVPLIATLTVVAAVLVIIGVKLATLFFNLAFNYVLAPLVAASDMHSGQRMKQVVQNIISIFMVTIMVFLSLKIYMIGADMLNDSTDGLVYVLGMIGLSVAVLDGPNIVERLFGLDAGLKSSLGALAGTYAAAKGATGATKAGVSGVKNISDKMSKNKEEGNGGSGGSGSNQNNGNGQDRENVSQAAEGQSGSGGTGNVANMADYRGNKTGTDSQGNDTANESVTDQGDQTTANGSASASGASTASSSNDTKESQASSNDANSNQRSIPSLHEEMDEEEGQATGTEGRTNGRANSQANSSTGASASNLEAQQRMNSSASGTNGQETSSPAPTEATDTDDSPDTANAPASATANADTGDTESVENINGASTGTAGTHRERMEQETDGNGSRNVEQDVQSVQGQQQASGGNVQTNQSGVSGESASAETPSTGNAPASTSTNAETGDTASVQNMKGETSGSAGTHREQVTEEMDGTNTQNVEQDVQTVQGQQQASGGNVQTNQSGAASDTGSPETPSTGNAPASASANTSGQDTASVQNMKGENTGSAGTHREQVTEEMDGTNTQNVEQDVQTVQGQQQASGGNVQTNQSGAAANAGSPETPSTGNTPASAGVNSSGQDTASVRHEQGPSNSSTSTHREQVIQETDSSRTQNVEQEVQTATNHRQDGGRVNTTYTSGGDNGGQADPTPSSSPGPGPSASASSGDAGGNSVRHERSTEQDVQQSVTHRQTEGRVNRRERVTEQQAPRKQNYDLGKHTRKTVKRNNKRT